MSVKARQTFVCRQFIVTIIIHHSVIARHVGEKLLIGIHAVTAGRNGRWWRSDKVRKGLRLFHAVER